MKSILAIFLITISLTLISSKDIERIKLTKSTKPMQFLGQPYGSIDKMSLNYPYLVNADFGSSKNNLMAISLFNSHVFVSNCPGVFKYFNCTDFADSCTQFPKVPYGADFPFFSVSGYRILLNMTLGNYGRGNRVKAFYPSLCTRNPFGNNDVVGSVGFSLNESNYFNFDTENNKFAIYLKRDASDGEILFGDDRSLRSEDPPMRIMGVTKNWELNIEEIYLLDSEFQWSGRAIFDINSNFLGLPTQVYDKLVADLKNRFNFVCDNLIIQPNCSYTKNISSLPSVILMPVEGSNPIVIPPTLYLNQLDNNLFQILFVSLTTNPIFGHQMFVTQAYADSMILGAPFFRYYYTVFNYQNPKNPEIDLYFYNRNAEDEGGISAWGIVGIVLGALLIIGIIVGSIYAFRKNRDRKRQETLVNPETRVNYVAYNQ